MESGKKRGSISDLAVELPELGKVGLVLGFGRAHRRARRQRKAPLDPSTRKLPGAPPHPASFRREPRCPCRAAAKQRHRDREAIACVPPSPPLQHGRTSPWRRHRTGRERRPRPRLPACSQTPAASRPAFPPAGGPQPEPSPLKQSEPARRPGRVECDRSAEGPRQGNGFHQDGRAHGLSPDRFACTARRAAGRANFGAPLRVPQSSCPGVDVQQASAFRPDAGEGGRRIAGEPLPPCAPKSKDRATGPWPQAAWQKHVRTAPKASRSLSSKAHIESDSGETPPRSP